MIISLWAPYIVYYTIMHVDLYLLHTLPHHPYYQYLLYYETFFGPIVYKL
jgi:hypothetical protein